MTIDQLIQRHQKIFQDALNSTSKLLDFAVNSEIESISPEAENRDRIFNVLNIIQDKINQELDSLSATVNNKDLIDRVKSWNNQVVKTVKDIEEADTLILKLLGQNRENTSKEIAQVKKNRSLFKGYNLNNVRR